MTKPHKHAALIKAWADGAEIEYRSTHDCGDWALFTYPYWEGLGEYRIKPEPDRAHRVFIGIDAVHGCYIDAGNLSNLKLTFDGKQLKKAEVI